MSTIVEPLQELAETRETTRQRRSLEAAVSDRREDVADQQKRIANLAPLLADPTNHDAEHRLTAERVRLGHLSAALESAQRELDEFSRVNPTDQQLADRERTLAKQIDDNAYRSMQERFGANMRRRCELLAELHMLETEAEKLYDDAKRQWPYANGVQPGAAGITPALVTFIAPDTFPSAGGIGVLRRDGYLVHKRAADAWIEKWNLQVAKGEQQK